MSTDSTMHGIKATKIKNKKILRHLKNFEKKSNAEFYLF